MFIHFNDICKPWKEIPAQNIRVKNEVIDTNTTNDLFWDIKSLKSQISSGVHWREHNREHTDLDKFVQCKNRFKNVNVWAIDQGNSWLLLAYNKVPFKSSVVFFHYNFFHSTPLGTKLLHFLYVHWYWS